MRRLLAAIRAAHVGAPALACMLLLSAACSAPPQKEIDRAQGAIDAARAAGADQYATDHFNAATAALQQAHQAVEQRDYRLALSRALDASERALEAAKEAANGKARARIEVDNLLTMTTASVQQLQTKLQAAEAAKLPQLERSRKLRIETQRRLQEARAAVKEGDYATGIARLKDVPQRITAEIKLLDDAMVERAARAKGRRR